MVKSTLLYITSLLLLPALLHAFSEVDDSDDPANYDRHRRGWSMMRLGRGLQMLRLGKRTSSARPLAPPQDGAQATPQQIRDMLANLIDETRSEMRRQPPLPRYGRELELSPESAEDLYSLLGKMYASRILPLHYAPRYLPARRYKRSALNAVQGEKFVQGSDARPSSVLSSSSSSPAGRAVALPRIGRYLDRLYKIRPGKAVPGPRIGRQEAFLEKPVEAGKVSGSGQGGQFSRSEDTHSYSQQLAGTDQERDSL